MMCRGDHFWPGDGRRWDAVHKTSGYTEFMVCNNCNSMLVRLSKIVASEWYLWIEIQEEFLVEMDVQSI